MLEQVPRTRASTPTLTPREQDVLRNVAEGLTNPEVARRLNVTVHAVKFLLHRAYQKLGTPNRSRLSLLLRGRAPE